MTILKLMLEEIKFLQADTKDISLEQFMNNERLKRSAAMTLINIGELVRHLSTAIKPYVSNLFGI